MIQRVSKRFLSLLLVAVMLLGMMPVITVPALAADASGELTSFDELIGLSYSSTSGTSAWTVDTNAKTVTGTVKTTSSSCGGTTQQDCTLTITSKLDIPAQISFDYTVEGTGTATVDGTTVTTGGSFAKEVEAGGSVQVFIKSGETGNDSLTLIVSNLLLAANVDVTTTFVPSKNGSYTVDGEEITTEKTITQSAMNAYAMEATPDEGYMFMGWYDVTNEKYLKLDSDTDLYLTKNSTVTAKFAPVGTAIFEAGGQAFDDLDAAGTYAKANSIDKIVLRTDGTITGNYTIPEGVTLLIPFDAAGTMYTTTPANTANVRTAPSVYRTLTMAPGSSITVNGAISVSAKHYAYGQYGAGAPDGKYGYIYMDEGSSIAVNNGGALYVWGFLSGKGMVTAHSGATVYENMQICDFRGGSATGGMNNNKWKVFPLNQYFVQNIEAKLVLESGADEYIYTSIYAGGSATSTSIHFIGDESAMFSVASGGYFEKEYKPDQDRMEISVHGDAQINSLTLKVYITVSSGNYVLPINNCMTLNIASGTTKITQDVALLAGVQVNVAQGAVVEVTQGSSLYVYDRDEWIAKNYASNAKFKSTLYSPTRTYNRTQADLVDAKVDINGTAIINGYGYTTAGGAAIISSEGTGKVIFNSGAGTETETYMFIDYGNTGDPIAITPAKLMNADETYTETAEAVNGDYWTYENGVWVPTLKDRVTLTLDANNGSKETQERIIAQNTPTVLEANPFTYEGFVFTGWNTESDGTGEAYDDLEEVTFDEATTLYAQWEVAKFTVTWRNGYTTIYTETLEYGQMPEFTGETPTKNATAQYTYTFKGWSPEPAPVTADVTYTAEFYQIVNQYTITWYDEDGTTELATSKVDYNVMPEYPNGTPAKAVTDGITYVFNGWSPTLAKVTKDASYTATFTEVPAETAVIWRNWDDTPLGTAKVETAGIVPEYDGDTPTRDADEQYTYTFSGWELIGRDDSGAVIYKAVFDETLRTYTITWKNDDGTILGKDTVEYGKTPACGKTPTKAADENYSYIFDGWTPAITEVTGDATYTAKFNKVELLTVTWKNGDKVLETKKVVSGTIPEYTGETPTKAPDDDYSYTFTGWDPAPAAITEDTVYNAKFTEKPREYTITWRNYDGTVLGTSQVAKGEVPQYQDSTPTKPYDADYSYQFSGWTPALTAVTGEATYTATFTATAFVKHTVTFDANGGEGTMEPQVFRVGVSETLRANAFTWKYHEFQGWNTEPDGSGETYADAGALIDLNGDITLYAQWEELIVPITSYADFLTCLKQLEIYANQYALEHPDEDAIALVINYIRSGVDKYNSGTWNTFCGPENTAFVNYVAEQEGSKSGAQRLRALEAFTLPNGDEVEFDHMFGCMDMAYHSGIQKTADLGSWAGDICDLVQLTTNAGVTGTVEEMAEEIRTNNDKYFLYDAPDAHSFGQRDLYGDLDAFYILTRLSEGRSISAIMESYFTKNLTDSGRAKFFLDNRFGGITVKSELRSTILETYLGNDGILTLEKSYVPDGVNADLRKACCYAFADYLYELAKDMLENPYYKVFSTENSTLAPGVTQQTKMALTQDGKQIVYYLASADVSRDDVQVCANYGLNDASSWRMTRVTDQMKAAEANHSNPESDRYEPNYSAVVGVNGDFYNMSTGAPSGALVMEGVEYNGVGSENFFGILKDGTPIIGGSAEWNANKDNIQEAIGASIYLVKDGKISVSSGNNYYDSRASRTCVGITYDGRVILMVLDGRQEPFSAGGAAIEIAQIMLDAGCVTAVNLDGGGSTTFATKAEGEENISVANRPSDGYERSVSSSLMIVSTAKPSNVFDHAVISADYDYLTVGTELPVAVSGVTATGGAIAIPENSTLRVSNETVGTLTDGVFTASALGEVQIQLIGEDGTELGSKTLHVVEPTDIRFTKSSINAIYGEATTLPLEATYNGNPVKINPDDVVFGYVKISLASIDMGGETVNTNLNELVYSYSEAGAIEGFDFTANEAGGLRTLTIGAILKNKTAEFEASYAAEYQRVYQEALSNQFTEDEARIQAQNAAISKALSEAAQTMAYMYKSDEAEFDFNTAHGDGLLSWHRTVPNSEYKDDTATYYLKGQQDETSINYTFAVDMSKVAIPEKLTKLLYMLPGGDQEGRTAWDFLLQLAERISPLTTVTISMHVPEGFTVDTSDLRLANELFTLSSCEVEDGVLTVVCNFIEQSESINPTTVNPLCVLSGLKLIADDGAWPLDGSAMECFAVGELSYDIYAHFHVLESLANDPAFQEEYGLYPYNNTANITGDSGAHFMETIINFEDQCFLAKDNTIGRNGWYRDNGALSYYVDGTALTGVQELPSQIEDESGMFWYDFGEEGKCSGKLTGFFELEGKLYYAINGQLVVGWQTTRGEGDSLSYYYFDPTTGAAVDGEQTIRGYHYVFQNCILRRGDLVTRSDGAVWYMWAGKWASQEWKTIDGKEYYFRSGYSAATGIYAFNIAGVNVFYVFDDQGVWQKDVSGKYDVGEDTYLLENGIVVSYPGLVMIDGDYYYFKYETNTAVKGCTYWISKTNGLLPEKNYTFDETGKMVDPPVTDPDPDPEVKNGIVSENGSLYYYVDGVLNYAGLIQIDGDYYYVKTSGEVIHGKSYWISKTNGLLPEKSYTFDETGKMVNPPVTDPDPDPEVKNGIVAENGSLYYYVDGVLNYAGLIQIDGSYYYVKTSGEVIHGKSYWISKTNGLLPEKSYTFDETGKMVNPPVTDPDPDPEMKNGIVAENGSLYYYVDGVLNYAGLIQIDGDYYYVKTSGEVIHGRSYWISKTNGLLPEKSYTFDDTGKMTDFTR